MTRDRPPWFIWPAGSIAFAGLLFALPLASVQEAPRRSEELPGIAPPAWQRGDAELARQWQRLTGRHIYEVACTSCHTWGPSHWERDRWAKYLRNFPGNHEPDVRRQYADLTAMFAAGKAVPNAEEQRQALTEFVISQAPPAELPMEIREKRFQGAAEIGSPAPRFIVETVDGRQIDSAQFRGKQPIILVFSRAHW